MLKKYENGRKGGKRERRKRCRTLGKPRQPSAVKIPKMVVAQNRKFRKSSPVQTASADTAADTVAARHKHLRAKCLGCC